MASAGGRFSLEVAMRCAICGAYAAIDDNFCRRCGAGLRNRRLPARRSVLAPALWRRAAPALAQGAAMLALGVAAEWLLRSAAKRALGLSARPARTLERRRALPARREELLPAGGVAMSETLILRRVTLRR